MITLDIALLVAVVLTALILGAGFGALQRCAPDRVATRSAMFTFGSRLAAIGITWNVVLSWLLIPAVLAVTGAILMAIGPLHGRARASAQRESARARSGAPGNQSLTAD